MRYIQLLALFLVALGTSLLAQSNASLFAPAVTYGTGGSNASSVAVADVNGDGNVDVVVANNYGDTVGVLFGNVDGTFEPVLTYGAGGSAPESVAVADVNGDRKPDLLVANFCLSRTSCASGGLGILLNNGNGAFQAPATYSSGIVGTPYSITVADVNEDGKPDLLVGNGMSGLVSVVLGNGDGSFQSAVLYASGGDYADSVAVADVNEDGKPDLLVVNALSKNDLIGRVGVLLGNGDGTLQSVVGYPTGGSSSRSVAVKDVNGDGKLDLVVANQCPDYYECGYSDGSVAVLIGNGDGTFQSAVSYGSGGTNSLSVAVDDLNADGKPDIVVANGCARTSNFSSCNYGLPGGLGVLLNKGDGTFHTAVTHLSGASSAWSVAVADVNGDRKPDLLVANFCSIGDTCFDSTINGTVGVLLNLGASPYKAFVQRPINSDGSSTFKANRGVIPVKFTLTENNAPTCTLPAATISVTRTVGGTPGLVDVAKFRVSDCQYIYNLPVNKANLGAAVYSVDIKINGSVVGNAVFALK